LISKSDLNKSTPLLAKEEIKIKPTVCFREYHATKIVMKLKEKNFKKNYL